jgi:hypothetical protein
MDSGTAIANARAAMNDGRTRNALDILRARLRAHPDEVDVRQQLAETYRTLGHPDQAGRWGSLIPGWSTRAEHNAFIRAFITPDIDEQRVEQLVAMPRGATLPPGIEKIVHPPNRHYRRFRNFAIEMETTARLMAFGVLIAAGATMVITTVVAFVGTEDARFVARMGATLTAIPVIGWSVTWAIANFIRSRWFRVALALVALVAAALVLYWLAPSPGAYFPWEDST